MFRLSETTTSEDGGRLIDVFVVVVVKSHTRNTPATIARRMERKNDDRSRPPFDSSTHTLLATVSEAWSFARPIRCRSFSRRCRSFVPGVRSIDHRGFLSSHVVFSLPFRSPVAFAFPFADTWPSPSPPPTPLSISLSIREGSEAGREEVRMQHDLQDQRTLLRVDAEALLDQVPEVVVFDGVQPGHRRRIALVDDGARGQQVQDGALALAAKVVPTRRKLVQEHPEGPGVVILLALELVTGPDLFGRGELRGAGLRAVILRGLPDGNGRFEVDPLHHVLAAVAAFSRNEDEVFRLQIRPDQPAGVHRLEAPADVHAGLAEVPPRQSGLRIAQEGPEVLIARFQYQGRQSLRDARGGRRIVGARAVADLAHVAGSAPLEGGEEDAALGKHTVVVLVFSVQALHPRRQLHGQPGAGGVPVRVGLVGVVDLAALRRGPDELSHQKVVVLPGSDDLPVEIVVDGGR
mmetsp:Transcript_17992/g.41481  ORF Transcript_17992/g.41481 Transcript_17992/m.41481 type:complete len:463 (-) Transcript_17992:867-2255(-)